MPVVFPSCVLGYHIRWPPGHSLEDDLGYWRVAYVRPRNEKALAHDCERTGVGYFLPLYEKRVRRRDNNKPRKSVLPLFLGYLPFVDRDGGKRCIYETKRVVRVLDVIDQESFVRDLAQIWQAVTSGAQLGVVETFGVGQKVRVNGGPLRGLVGVVQEVRKHLRLLLNMEAFQVAVTVELDGADVKIVR